MSEECGGGGGGGEGAPPVEDVSDRLDEITSQLESSEEIEEIIAENEEVPSNGTPDLVDFEDTSESGGTDVSQNLDNTPNRANRELKSILALSKEAKLDTNLTHRRKTLDANKPKDSMALVGPKKVKNAFFPVTAECEIENSSDGDERFDKNVKKAKKNKQNVSDSSVEGAADTFRKMHPPKLVMLKPNKDLFCWRCHHDNVNIACETCPRTYHQKCLKQTVVDTEHWPCPECVSILKAENTQTRSKAIKGMTLEHLCSLLKFAVKRMKQCDGSEPFINPVDSEAFPEYNNYIVYPMNLSTLELNIKANSYGSTQAFEADAKWILHNSIIFNSYLGGTKTRAEIDQDKNTLRKDMTSPRNTSDQSKLTNVAKSITKICKQEMAEIENCPSCYMNANTKKHTWFVEVCPKPHLLVWAKLKGFPYWPAKVMSITATGMADVRFFGAHDKAWISIRDCYMYSNKDPNSGKQKRNDIIECVRELEVYVENLRKIYGRVDHYPFKMPLEPGKEMKYLKMFLPSFTAEGKPVDLEANKVEPEIEAENGDLSQSDEKIEESGEKTKLEFKSTQVSVKPKWVVKPLKTVVIRKRHSDNTLETVRKVQRREDDKNLSLNEGELKPPPTKLKITYQLIKKLSPSDETGEKPAENAKEEVGGEKVAEKKPEEGDGMIQEPNKGEVKENETLESQVVIEKDADEKPEEKLLGDMQNDGKESVVDEDDDRQEVIALELVEAVVDDKAEEKTPENLEKMKKRKHEEPQRNSTQFPPNKMVKLVPIENILQKKDPPPLTSPKINTDVVKSNKQKQLIVLKEIRVVKDGKDRKSTSAPAINTKLDHPVLIKNEVESGDEDHDVQYMEAKRQYMSALNISEKQKTVNKPTAKQHEIRTRSKTEEKRTVIEKKTQPHDEICIKPLSKFQAPKSKARKTFPSPNYTRKSLNNKAILPKPPESMNSSLEATPNLVLLPKLHYAKTVPSDSVVVVPKTTTNSTAIPCPPLTSSLQPSTSRKKADESQNYIPQNETKGQNGALLNNLLVNGSGVPPLTNEETSNRLDSELGILKEILPENVAKGVGDILCHQPPPPKLKPKPFGILNSICDQGIPSSAGPATSRINNLGDYFRTLLVETVNELGKSPSNPDAAITNLKLEMEDMNHRHATELLEIRRNVSVVLKDIQKSIHEERERIINETRANCELDMQKRVDEAKSKQWCANCLKEAQFYCCWNTSYCDYPCQQKHWPKHVNKCTQNASQQLTTSSTNNSTSVGSCSSGNQTSSTSRPSLGQPLVLTTASSPKYGNLFSKPQKVYLKRSGSSFKQQSNHITLVESTPGNFELVGSGAIAVNGKILASTSVIEKIKSGNIVTVTAPSTGGTSTELTNTNQKVTITTKSAISRSSSDLE